jgi:ferredoxin-thioredoxin reductase catalytic chain
MDEKKTIIETMQKDAADNGYFLCPDASLFNDLIDGLATNTARYGYGSCPCRVASGVKQNDVDIICPCEYRDADVDEFGMCYCGLFVNKEVKDNPSRLGPIPERRPSEITDAALAAAESKQVSAPKAKTGRSRSKKEVTVWRCTVCGYLCARDMPPPVCPICKAKAERFEEFVLR